MPGPFWKERPRIRESSLQSLTLHLSETPGGGLEKIVVEYRDGERRTRQRGRDWKSNARTETLIAALALLVLRGDATGEPGLDGRKSPEEATLCARIHDLWHTPRKRPESHWLDSVFDRDTRDLPSPLAAVLTKTGSRERAVVGLAEGVDGANLRFFRLGRPLHRKELASILQSSIGIRHEFAKDSRALCPQFTGGFFGRETLLEELQRLVATHALIVLVGPHGIGKTRLACAAAQLWRGPTVFLRADPTDPFRSVAEHQGPEGSGTLYIIDQDSTVETSTPNEASSWSPEGTSTRIAASVHVEPSDRFLVTALEPLGIDGERIILVPPLTVPTLSVGAEDILKSVETPHTAAEQLFLDRAGQNAATTDTLLLRTVCSLTGGVPRVLELAADALDRFPLSALPELLETQPSLLSSRRGETGTARGALDRLMRETFTRLSPAEQSALRCLAWLPQGWSLEAAGSVTAYFPAVHDRLLACGIVASIGPDNFDIMTPLRHGLRHGWADFDPSLSAAAAGSVLDLALQQTPTRGGANATAVSETLHAGLDVALTSSRLPEATRLLQRLFPLWIVTGKWTTGRAICRRLLEHPGLAPSDRIAALSVSAGLEFQQGEIPVARTSYEELLREAQTACDPHAEAQAHHGLGSIAFRTNHLQEAESHFQDALRGWSVAEHGAQRLLALNNLAAVAASRGAMDVATTRFEDVAKTARQVGDDRTLASTLHNLGLLRWQMKEESEAEQLFSQSLKVWDRLRDPWGRANAMNSLAAIALAKGDLGKAREMHTESLRVRAETEDLPGVAGSLEGFASLALAAGAPARALQLLAASASIRQEYEIPLDDGNQRRVQAEEERAAAALEPHAVSVARTLGRAMTWREAVAFALER